ncbi:TPA: metallophosphoesterase [Escherichia coli]|nr:metallophosphoesterase [Escherichia coli]
MSIYQRINGADWRNIWVVGDLHGCYTSLMTQLGSVDFDPEQDLLISVGDLIDRGTENVECLELIEMPWFRAVRGNHEQMMIDALAPGGMPYHWVRNGGAWFFNLDYDQDRLVISLVRKAADLPLIIELVTGDRKVVICHADYPIVTPTASSPISISVYDSTRPLLGSQVRLEVERTAQLDFDLRQFSSLPGLVMIIGNGGEFHLDGKLSVGAPAGVVLNNQGASRILTTPSAEIEVSDASIDFGTFANKAKAYTSDGVPLISGTEYSGPAGDGYVVKEPSGAMRAYGDKNLGSRIASGAGTFADPYTTTGPAITFGATFIAPPTVTLQYKVTPGVATDIRRGVIAIDSISSTATSPTSPTRQLTEPTITTGSCATWGGFTDGISFTGG